MACTVEKRHYRPVYLDNLNTSFKFTNMLVNHMKIKNLMKMKEVCCCMIYCCLVKILPSQPLDILPDIIYYGNVTCAVEDRHFN